MTRKAPRRPHAASLAAAPAEPRARLLQFRVSNSAGTVSQTVAVCSHDETRRVRARDGGAKVYLEARRPDEIQAIAATLGRQVLGLGRFDPVVVESVEDRT